jgi:hypothetical protein
MLWLWWTLKITISDISAKRLELQLFLCLASPICFEMLVSICVCGLSGNVLHHGAATWHGMLRIWFWNALFQLLWCLKRSLAGPGMGLLFLEAKGWYSWRLESFGSMVRKWGLKSDGMFARFQLSQVQRDFWGKSYGGQINFAMWNKSFVPKLCPRIPDLTQGVGFKIWVSSVKFQHWFVLGKSMALRFSYFSTHFPPGLDVMRQEPLPELKKLNSTRWRRQRGWGMGSQLATRGSSHPIPRVSLIKPSAWVTSCKPGISSFLAQIWGTSEPPHLFQ